MVRYEIIMSSFDADICMYVCVCTRVCACIIQFLRKKLLFKSCS